MDHWAVLLRPGDIDQSAVYDSAVIAPVKLAFMFPRNVT